jgi:hypothetical protein
MNNILTHIRDFTPNVSKKMEMLVFQQFFLHFLKYAVLLVFITYYCQRNLLSLIFFVILILLQY